MTNYNQELPQYLKTAGKITIITALTGLLVFLVAFVFDVGHQELQKVSAQTATTTLTVLNTPPTFTVNAYEVVESSTSTPTNSGDNISWTALGSDSNGAPYFLLICDRNATPTAKAASGPGNLGSAPPECNASAVQWGVSASAPSDTYATVATTTTEAAPFAESNDWFAWVCDDDPVNPRCNATPVQGISATNSSPFNVNSRPIFTNLDNNGPVDPGGQLLFSSTSSDPDVVDDPDELYLVICSTNSDYNPVTNTCDTNFLASTTLQNMLSDATATYTLAAIVQDDTYSAYGYLVDTHGHEALANPIQADFVVNNVPPTVLGGDITLNAGSDISLTEPGGETTGFTLDFTLRDANSCENASGGDEMTDFLVSVFRSGIGTTTCDGTGANYDPNNCYPSGIGATTWNLSCSATTTCSGPTQDDIDYSCTFPLWFVADPTDNAAPNTPASLKAQNWTAAVAGVDDNAATGTLATTSSPVNLTSFVALEILANDIAYGGIEPGDDTGTLSATSTLENVGNTGLDQSTKGEAMCGTFSVGSPCPVSASSTIPADQQQFASSSLTYGSAQALSLSGVDQELELDVSKTTSTSTPQQGVTYWGIAVPASITLAGNYTGLNTFTAVTAEPSDW